MARVQIELPRHVHFTTEIPVMVRDINAAGHLANDALFAILHEARHRWLASRGWSEASVEGAAVLLADAAVIYRREGFWGMRLEVTLAVTELRTRSFDLVYRVVDLGSGEEIARAKHGAVFFDHATKASVAVPAAFRAACAS
jgi:acyl-CoA thioester hydrolase